MKVAKIELGAKELDLLRSGKPIIIRLPDARIEVALAKGAVFVEKIEGVLRGMRDVIDRGKGGK